MFRKLIVLIAVFNALMIVAFILSNVYIWDLMYTQITLQGGRQDNGIYVIPFIHINGLQVTIGHDAYAPDGVAVPTAVPISVPNYPFIIFWVTIVGDLVLLALVLRKRSQEKISGEN